MPPASSYQDGNTARLYVHIARDAPVGVVLRRGPSKQTLMLKWDMTTETFEEGQWFIGRIYERRCDLSPCGEHFAYFGAKHRPPFGAFTAISPPPYYSAHILWPKSDCWGGGGLFDAANETFELNHSTKWLKEKKEFAPNFAKGEAETAFGKLPPPYKAVAPHGEWSGCGEDLPIEHARMTRDGWNFKNKGLTATIPSNWEHIPAPDEGGIFFYWKTEGAIHWTKTARNGRTLTLIQDQAGQIDGRWNIITCQLTTTKGTVVDFQRVDWADFDKNDDLLYARNGCLYRVKPGKEEAPHLIIDLNNRTFKNVLAPKGMARHDRKRAKNNENENAEDVPDSTGWHPLDDS